MKSLAFFVVASALIFSANQFGIWQMSVAIGALYALCEARLRRGIWGSLGAGIFGWGLPLVLLQSTSDVIRMARLLANMIGIGDGGQIVVLVLPSLIGGLLALCGAWVASALKHVLTASFRPVNRGESSSRILS